MIDFSRTTRGDILKEIFNKMKKYRRDLHQIPELGYDLYKTHDYVKRVLVGLGYHIDVVAKTGILAFKQGKVSKTIAFRADMDALPIMEKLQVDFRSKHEGMMHACGHDAHMAILLGFAEIMSRKALDNSLLLVFEPAEETLGGAKDIIASKAYQNYDIEAIFALHVDPELESGKLGFNEGVITAQDGDFDVEITGINAHGTSPHQGQDALLAASALIQHYYTILSRSLDPLVSATINIGTINAGEGRNIIPYKAHLSGSIRAFDYFQYSKIKTRMNQVDKGIETAYNVHVESRVIDLHPPVNNNHELFMKLCQVFNQGEYEIIQPRLFAEDFSYYQQNTKGFFMLLGTKNPVLGYTHALHSAYFDFDETVLEVGLLSFIKIASAYNVL